MSTETPETETADTSTDNQRFEPAEIRKRLPSGINEKRQRIAICLIRNPDASLTRVAATNNVSATTVFNTVKGLLHGSAPEGDGGQRQSVERRNGVRHAETYEELTDKQRAVVDWFARRPGALESFKDKGKGTLTGERVATTISQDSRYDVSLTTTYPYKIVDSPHEPLIEERRRWLAAHGEIDEGNEEAVTESLRGKGTRDLLTNAGYDLPEANLDSLPTASEDEDVAPEDMSEQRRLDEAYRRGQQKDEEEPVTEEDRKQYSAPYGCPNCGRQHREDFCENCGTDKRYEWAKEDEEADEDADTEPDLSDELEQPLVDNVEALNEALKGIMERLNKHERAIDTLRESAVTEDEVEAIVDSLEERMGDALETHRGTVMDHVAEELEDEILTEVDKQIDERLRNSVKRDLMDRVEDLEEYMEEHPTDGGADAEGRLGLLLADLRHYAGAGAYVTSMDVEDGTNVTTYSFKVHHGGKTPRKARTNGGEDE